MRKSSQSTLSRGTIPKASSTVPNVSATLVSDEKDKNSDQTEAEDCTICLEVYIQFDLIV